MKEISINDKKSGITYKLTPVLSGKVKDEDFDEIREQYPDLADSIVAYGGSCVAFYAVNENGHRYLVKRFTNDQSGERSSEIIKKIIAKHDKLGINYFLDDCLTGTDGETTYHVFTRINGETPSCQCPNTPEGLLRVLCEYKSFLESMKILHEIGYAHFDIKPENIFRFKANSSDTSSMQILDFGSCVEIDKIMNDIKRLGKRGYRYSSTLKWYGRDDIDELCTFVSSGIEGLEFVLDLTAAIKVLCFLICGKSDGFNFDNLEITKYDGICTKLHEMYYKATNSDFTRRYVLCEEIIRDVDLLIGAINGKIVHAESMRIISKNTLLDCNETISQDKLIAELKNEYLKENKRKANVSISDLIKQISVDILPSIFVGESVYSYSQHANALETVINKHSGNIALFGAGGGGKSTALKYLYLSALEKSTKNTYLYLCARDFENEANSGNENNIIAILSSRYKNCRIKDLVFDKSKKITILLDALDELPNEKDVIIYREIEELSKYSNRFVITSRENRGKRKILSSTTQGEFLPLTEEQIVRAVPSIENIKKYPIYKLLKTPMLLVIFKKLEALGEYKKNIRYSEELIEEYLKKIYLSHNSNTILFDKFIRDTAGFCVCKIIKENSNKKREIEEFLKREHLDHIISSVFQFNYRQDNGSNDNHSGDYKVTFAHKLYEDYFKGRWLFDFFSQAIKNDYLEVSDFYFDAFADIEKSFSPYWAKKLSKIIVEWECMGEDDADIYTALNRFISRFRRADVVKKISSFGKNERRYQAIRNIIQMIVLCCDGELVDYEKNIPLIKFKAFNRHFSTVANYDAIRSLYIPWYVNVHFHIGYMSYFYESSIEEEIENRNKQGDKETSRKVAYEAWSKKLVVSKWNLSCKSIGGSIYNKIGTRLILATGANKENDCFEIPKGVISIDKEAFRHCSCKTISSKSKMFYEDDGILYKRFPKTLVRYPSRRSDTSFKLTDAKRVYPYAFANTDKLKSVDLSASKQLILPKAVFEGSDVEYVNISPQTVVIGERSFYGCELLRKFDIPSSTMIISKEAFFDCRGIKSFVTGKKLKYIGHLAVANTTSISNLWINDGCLFIANNAFRGCKSKVETNPNKQQLNTKFSTVKIVREDSYDNTYDLFKCVHLFDHGHYDRFFKAINNSRRKKETYANTCNLAICYEKGIGVKADLNKALELYNSLWYYEDEYVVGKIEKLKKII